METVQKTESIKNLLELLSKKHIVLPEFQRDFVWEEAKTHELFDSLIRDIFIGSLIYGIPSFGLTVREFDTRPRRGTGSRKPLELTYFSLSQINKKVKTEEFRLLLDGQQRITALYRALTGADSVWIIIKNSEELDDQQKALTPAVLSLEQGLYEVAESEDPDRLSINLSEVYSILEGKITREKDKANMLAKTKYCKKVAGKDLESSKLFELYLIYSNKILDMLKAEKLLSYFLLDTSEEKFAMFFERSNTRGIILSFIDILAAKLYAGFNLRQQIEKFEGNNPEYELNKEVIVRGLSFIISSGKDIGRTYILMNLTHTHFTKHWEKLCILYTKCFEYLHKNHYLLTQNWMPYENMIIPLIIFLREIPHNDFSEINEIQSEIIRYWYWSSIFSLRYSAAAGSVIIEDSNFLKSVAKGDYSNFRSYPIHNQSRVQEVSDLYLISKQYSAIYKGVLNLVNYKVGGLVDWKNNNKLIFRDKVEDHHIFPRDYLNKFVSTNPEVDEHTINCVLNRTLIPKMTNIKFGNKKPSDYLKEIRKSNSKIRDSLKNHMIPPEILDGIYDDLFPIFIEDRGKEILKIINDDIFAMPAQILSKISS